MPKQQVYEKYNLSPDTLLGIGMEAEVYTYKPDTVLKLYDGPTTLTHLRTLKAFYDSLDASQIPYALPHIYSITKEDTILITIEQRLLGTSLSALLSSFNPQQLADILQKYLLAVLDLSKVTMSPSLSHYKLFNRPGISQSEDWHQFLIRYLDEKLVQVEPYLGRDVANFTPKVDQLQDILAQPYTDRCTLIHGDFCPGNLMNVSNCIY